MILPAWISAAALTISPDGAGQVKSLVGDSPDISSLAIDGPISYTDLKYIAGLKNLRSLDLSKAEIAVYRANDEYYPDNVIPSGIFAGAQFTQFEFPATERLIVEDAAFAGAAVEEIFIPESVASVGEGAFAGSALKTATLNGKTSFGASAFADCTALDNVSLGGLTDIPARMFAGCTALATVNGAENVTSIGDRAFRGDAGLVSFEFGPALKSVGMEAFAGAGLEVADLSQATALTSLAPRAFAHNAALTYAAFGPAMKDLGEGVFFGCGALATVDAQVTEIPDYAYVNDTSLDITSAYTPATTSIGAYALKGMEQVVQLNLYPALEHIGDHAMQGMTGLESIDAREMTSVPSLGENVWEGVKQDLVELYALGDMADSFEAAAQWQDFYIVKLSTTLTIDSEAVKTVSARFEGPDLVIRSAHSPIAEAVLYDTAGTLLTRVTPGTITATVETSQWSTRIYIICVTLADGTRATSKLIRQ